MDSYYFLSPVHAETKALCVVTLPLSPLPFQCCGHSQRNPAERPDSGSRRVTTSMKIGHQVEDQHDPISLLQGRLWTPLENPHRWKASSVLQVLMWLTGHMPRVGYLHLLDQRGELGWQQPFFRLIPFLFSFGCVDLSSNCKLPCFSSRAPNLLSASCIAQTLNCK